MKKIFEESTRKELKYSLEGASIGFSAMGYGLVGMAKSISCIAAGATCAAYNLTITPSVTIAEDVVKKVKKVKNPIKKIKNSRSKKHEESYGEVIVCDFTKNA